MKKCFVYIIVFIVLSLERLSAQEVDEVVDAVVGHTAELPCNISAENENDKLTVLAWYKNESSKAIYSSHDQRSGKGIVSSSSSRFRLVKAESEGLGKLQILTVRPADEGIYICSADFASSPTLKTYVKVVVIEPPQRLYVVSENGTRVETTSDAANVSRNIGPYYIGDTVNLFCIAYGGKPQASLSWWATQRLLKNTWVPLSEQRVRSDVRYGPLVREDHGLVLTCTANNNQVTPPLFIDVIINMHLPPELVVLRVPFEKEIVGGRVRAGESLALQCRVLGARPAPPILWRLNNTQLVNLEQNITTEATQRLVVSDIQLTIDQRHDESKITCCAPVYGHEDQKILCAQDLPLTVLYPPVLEIVVDEELNNRTIAVVKGSNLLLNCSYEANPSIYQLTWYHEEDVVLDDGKSSQIRPTLELSNISEEHAGEYVCAASNDEGSTYSEPLVVDVTYPAYCEEEAIAQYGVRQNETVNITCSVKSNPEPSAFRWVIVNDTVDDINQLRHHPHITIKTEEPYLSYERPNDTPFSTVFCWGLNEVPNKGLPHSPCIALVTDETAPRPPTQCLATSNNKDITILCEKGHDGGLPQKFKLIVKSTNSENQYLSITSLEPKFVIQKPETEEYTFLITAFNEKGESTTVEIERDSIIKEKSEIIQVGTVANITTLTLALCGGVALVALAACGLVLCARERDRRDGPVFGDPPLCAYNTEESNCETYHDSDDGSECNIRRTDSFRRAVSKYPSRNYDVRRTSSFHSARYMNDMVEEGLNKCNDGLRHSATCRMHSLQNINKKKNMDVLCDHLAMHLPTEPANYSAPKPMNTFYTMPRKMRYKAAKELSDETSEITQNSDGFSLPPPPDEFSSYRAGTKIKDMPTKTTPTYTTIRKNSTKETPKQQYNNVIISPMNTVGLPTISGHTSIYSYPDDHHHNQQDSQTTTGILSTFKGYSSPKESGL
ncbi:neural cell adhesion molecule 2-like [Galleria mellonella]|uniref:Neural cell adhesion molecule 2-like n=1 Tax=Galleria mellonella TaxID=7137 RepID=A0ABM3MGW3_GALME|nr:neural cell adhesion molecule 2-like [Galleria mellonella]